MKSARKKIYEKMVLERKRNGIEKRWTNLGDKQVKKEEKINKIKGRDNTQ